MAGYQTIEALRPILHRGPVPTPVVNRDLVRPRNAEAAQRRVAYKGKAGVPVPEEVIAEIVDRREKGESYLAIMKGVGVSSWAVKKFAGHIQPPNGQYRNGIDSGATRVVKFNKPFADRLRRAGFSYKEIGEELGCAPSVAWRLIVGKRASKSKRSAIYRTLFRVEVATGIPRQTLKKDSFGHSCRADELAKARHIAFWVIRNTHTHLSFPAIGAAMGGFHHTSVLHGYRKADAAASKLGLKFNKRPLAIVKALWAADWREVGK